MTSPIKQDKPHPAGQGFSVVSLFPSYFCFSQERVGLEIRGGWNTDFLSLFSLSLSSPSPMWRDCAQRHHRPRPLSQLPWQRQRESVLCVDDRSSWGPEAAPSLWEAVAAWEGQVNLWGSSQVAYEISSFDLFLSQVRKLRPAEEKDLPWVAQGKHCRTRKETKSLFIFKSLLY